MCTRDSWVIFWITCQYCTLQLKRAAQKEAWKERKRLKRAKVLETGGSTKSKPPTLFDDYLEETSFYFENGEMIILNQQCSFYARTVDFDEF